MASRSPARPAESPAGRVRGRDDLADAAGTIGYEILTGLGRRYTRVYVGGAGGTSGAGGA